MKIQTTSYLQERMEPIVGADPDTFEVMTRKALAKGVARDKNSYYIGMEKATKKEVRDVP